MSTEILFSFFFDIRYINCRYKQINEKLSVTGNVQGVYFACVYVFVHVCVCSQVRRTRKGLLGLKFLV